MRRNELMNVNIEEIEPIIAPRFVRNDFPVSKKAEEFVVESRKTIADIMSFKDDRFMVVVGPCSIHDPSSALEYAEKLRNLQTAVADKMFLVMRAYVEKPRTTVGWKGLVNDPDLNETYDISKGLRIARKLYRDITEMGVPIANEMLDTMTPQYLAEFISWGAIGARTTEAQSHRELVSGLSFPLGFKNGTDGNIIIAVQAMATAKQKHCFLGINEDGLPSIVKTRGNENVHVVLRGAKDIPNYMLRDIKKTENLLHTVGKFLNSGIMVDCSHGNCSSQHRLQRRVLEDGIEQILSGNITIKAWMIESHLKEGSQKINSDSSKLEYGVSITDSCMSFEEMATNLLRAVDRLRHEKVDRYNTFAYSQDEVANY